MLAKRAFSSQLYFVYFLEEWQSGRSRLSRKQIHRKVTGVQIPPLPIFTPTTWQDYSLLRLDFWALKTIIKQIDFNNIFL